MSCRHTHHCVLVGSRTSLIRLFVLSQGFLHYGPRHQIKDGQKNGELMFHKPCIETVPSGTINPQARDQLGTPGGVKSFLRVAQIF